MTDRAAALVLELADELGVLAIYVLWYEVLHFAGEREFTTGELCAWSALPENARLRQPDPLTLGAVEITILKRK